MTIPITRSPIRLLVWTSAVLLLFGCTQKNEYVEPPPPAVTVAQPIQQTVTDYLEFTGTTKAVEFVEVRARVSGILESMHFQSGTRVEKGDLLFVIDPRPYQADLQAAEAEMASVQVEVRKAEIELERAQKLYKKKAGSEANVVKWEAQRDAAKADLLRRQAQVDKAALLLSYTQVTAPTSGRVDRNLVDVGNLVGEGEATLLTAVTDYTPMYAYFHLNERDLLRVLATYRTQLRETGGEEQSIKEAKIPLWLALANEEDFPHQGLVDYADSGVDAETGTIELRGVFANDETPVVLLPGLFVRLRMPVGTHPDALLVTDRALGADQGGRFLLVVTADNEVEKRNVVVGQRVGHLRIIEKGLQPGEWVVIKGLQKARPGAKVAPQRADMGPPPVEEDLPTATTPSQLKALKASKASKTQEPDRDKPGVVQALAPAIEVPMDATLPMATNGPEHQALAPEPPHPAVPADASTANTSKANRSDPNGSEPDIEADAAEADAPNGIPTPAADNPESTSADTPAAKD